MRMTLNLLPDHFEKVKPLIVCHDDILARAIQCIASAHRNMFSPFCLGVVRATQYLQSTDNAPAVQMFIVKGQIIAFAQLIKRILHGYGPGQCTVFVVKANILGADVG